MTDASFEVRRGEVVGFLGPNGAGKSTTMRMLTGYLPPTAGSAAICGFDIGRAPQRAQLCFGYLAEGAPLYGDMTPEGLLAYVAALHGLRGKSLRARVDAMIDRVSLKEVLLRRIETLSKGYRRRVALACALVHDPDVLILDEPTDGLDPNQKQVVRDLIGEIAPEKAILISTHLLDEVDALCDRVLVINRGVLVYAGTSAALKAGAPGHNSVGAVVPARDETRAVALVSGWTDVERVERSAAPEGIRLRVIPRDARFMADRVVEAWRQNGLDVTDITVEMGRLEDAFRALTLDRDIEERV